MTTKQQEGYDLAKGALICIGHCLIIGFLIVGGFNVLRLTFGGGMDDTDKSTWKRSGLAVHVDAKTGIEYLSDGKGGLVRRYEK